MPIPEPPRPIRFVTDDELVTFVFTIARNPSGRHRDPVVSADIALLWEAGSPPEPVTAELGLRHPAQLAHISDNGYTLDGTLSLQAMPDGRIAILADVQYGDRDDHHLGGVLGIFSIELG
jgi:hypothetical protein